MSNRLRRGSALHFLNYILTGFLIVFALGTYMVAKSCTEFTKGVVIPILEDTDRIMTEKETKNQ